MKKTPSRKTVLRHRKRRVALLVDFSRGYGRALLLGVAKFVREHHEWSVQIEEWRWTEPVPSWLCHWKGDGVIAWVEEPQLGAIVRRLGVPAVDVRGAVPGCGLPLVDAENETVSSLAAEHLVRRGFRHYAFCGFAGANYSVMRRRWFQECLARSGFECAVYEPPARSFGLQAVEQEKRGLRYQEHLASWLKSLPKPVGIMACNDIRGQQVMNACRSVDLLVPEDVAVIGVDNDQIFCELSDPSLTSVELDTLRTGYEAAALLEHLMAGAKAPVEPILVPPVGIVTRGSTDVLAMNDSKLVAGIRFMRQHLFDELSVNDLARAAGMSRRVFERRFAAQVGRAPKAEVLRLRLERAKALLADTDWPLAQIAERTGFHYGEYLHTVFTQKMGTTPGQFRRSAKLEFLEHTFRSRSAKASIAARLSKGGG
jgi:LacI family transcriptional regulator, galactose operon repressor